MSNRRVRKAVFPVAGLGTRLLPATKAIAQGNADDRRSAADPICRRRGARGGHRADDLRHRARQVEPGRLFRHRLRARGDDARAGKSLDSLGPSRADYGEIVSVRQQQPLGLGHAVWCARAHRRRRAVRGAAARRSDGRQARRAEADGRRLCRVGGNMSARPRSARRQDRKLWRHRPGRDERRG